MNTQFHTSSVCDVVVLTSYQSFFACLKTSTKPSKWGNLSYHYLAGNNMQISIASFFISFICGRSPSTLFSLDEVSIQSNFFLHIPICALVCSYYINYVHICMFSAFCDVGSVVGFNRIPKGK